MKGFKPKQVHKTTKSDVLVYVGMDFLVFNSSVFAIADDMRFYQFESAFTTFHFTFVF